MNINNSDISSKKILTNFEEKKKEEDKKSKENCPSYLKITKMNILKELFNTFEGFSKSNEKENSKWEFAENKEENEQIRLNTLLSNHSGVNVGNNKDFKGKNFYKKNSNANSSSLNLNKNILRRNSTNSSKDTVKENFYRINRDYTINLSKFDDKQSMHQENNNDCKLFKNFFYEILFNQISF